MAENSKIEWTDHTFNPWIGCTKVAPGCTHCYAEAFSKRTGKAKWGDQGTRVKTSAPYWRNALKWDRDAEREGVRKRVFCASMADVFEDWGGDVTLSMNDLTMCCQSCGLGCGMPIIQRQLAPPKDQCPRCKATMQEPTLDGVRRMLFELIDTTPHLDWLLLTKRPENVREMWPRCAACRGNGRVEMLEHCPVCSGRGMVPLRKNVWIGCSVSEQETADKNLPHLVALRELTPVLFVSHEPALGYVDPVPGIDWWIIGVESSGKRVGRLTGYMDEHHFSDEAAKEVYQCRVHGVSPFIKQLPINGRVSHDLAEWPENLRTRDFPERFEHAR